MVVERVARIQQMVAGMHRARAEEHPRASDEAEYLLGRAAGAEAVVDRVRDQMESTVAWQNALYPSSNASDGRAR